MREHALRALDAVHLATALELRDEARELPAPRESNELRVLLMTYDRSLTEAARQEDFAHERESPPPPGTSR